MALTITAIVVLRNPALTGDSRLSDMIELATPKLSTAAFGDNFNEAVALLVLHMYEIGDRGGAGGPVTSEGEGGLARSFAATASSGALSDTSWGRELERLTKSLHFFPRTRMMT